jgi:beta-barrel assembly-enhancing protease
MNKLRLAIVFMLLVGGAALASLGPNDGRVNLSSLMALWSDAVRDTDQIGMRLTRLSDGEEMRIGSELAPSVLTWGSEDTAASAYVTAVAQSLLPHVQRPGIHYMFRVIDTPEVNAFAMPGGQVFATTGLLAFAESEAELAAVLGHEISHVDLRHCVERYQYEYRLKKAGMPEAGWMVETAHRLATMGFSPYQESDADLAGERLAIAAGYDPDAAAALFERMKIQFGEPTQRRATTPAGEVGQAVDTAIGSYFRTHPPSADRARQLNEMVAQHRSELKGRSFYVGKQNLAHHVARSRQLFPGEFRTL